ncbi:omptin family outer membrane protease [Sinorhizobium mexicanum]|nr:omptin family outer membrane protease [Sinorhizobium mexicanum]
MGRPGIRNSYRQKVPVSFIGLSGHQAIGDLRIRGGIQGGLSLGIRDIDDHLGGPALSDDMDPAPAIGATVAVNYALTPGASLYLSGSFERVFHNRGKMEIRDLLDGTRLPWTKDEAGRISRRSRSPSGSRARSDFQRRQRNHEDEHRAGSRAG